MIIPNGTIQITRALPGGFVNGKPQQSKTEVSGHVAANINENRRSWGIVAEQTANTTATYTILVEPSDAPGISDRDKVELFDSRGISLGQFEIASARLLDYVDAIQITTK